MSQAASESIPSIKYFGTTWYERGWPYRRRRIRLSAFMLFLVAIAVGTVALLFSALFDLVPSWPGRLYVIIGCVLPMAWSCWSSYMKLRRSPEDRAAYRPMSFAPSDPKDIRAGASAGIATGVFASGGSGVAGGLIAVGMLFVIGQVLGMFVISLGRYVNEEEWQLARKYGLEKK